MDRNTHTVSCGSDPAIFGIVKGEVVSSFMMDFDKKMKYLMCCLTIVQGVAEFS
jgi:hypothetical protein